MGSMGGPEIPARYASALRYRPSADTRTDDEVFQSITVDPPVPVTSEKNIWGFWHSGAKSMPAWQRRNVIQWARMNPGWTVRIVDSVPSSPYSATKFVPADILPKCLVEGTMDGAHKGQHAADMLRSAFLVEHGGAWLDVGIILIRGLDSMCWSQLEDPNNSYTIATPLMYGFTILNYFVVARKGDPFIKRWHELFVHLWKDRTNAVGILATPLLGAVMANLMNAKKYDNSGWGWEPKVDSQTILEYVTQIWCWHRVCFLQDPTDGFDGPGYWSKKVLLFNGLAENFAAETAVGFPNIGRLLDLLSLKNDEETRRTNAAEWEEANNLVWHLLADCSMQKISRGGNMFKTTHLGTLLDRPENGDKDATPGSFGELLRWGCVHLEQTRPDTLTLEAEYPEIILKEPLLG